MPEFARNLKYRKLVLNALLDSLVQNELEIFQELLVTHLRSESKSLLAAETKIGRQTLYDLLNSKKRFNPTLTTLGAILRSLT